MAAVDRERARAAPPRLKRAVLAVYARVLGQRLGAHTREVEHIVCANECAGAVARGAHESRFVVSTLSLARAFIVQSTRSDTRSRHDA